MPTAHIALGSNLGERHALLVSAVRSLESTADIQIRATSPIYETAPVGPAGQADYLNAVIEIETELPPHALLDRLLEIENRHGRVRRERWGARTLDLDLLCYERLSLDDARLTLPHPRMRERAFVMIPFAAISPSYRFADGTRADALAAKCDLGGIRRRDDISLQ